VLGEEGEGVTFEEWWSQHVSDPKYLAGGWVEECWNASRDAEREACIRATEAEHVGETVADECDNESDRTYNAALRDAIGAMRARGEKPDA
jgi:hypothetical protein